MRERVADAMRLIFSLWYPLMIYSFFCMGAAAALMAAGFSPYGEDAVVSTAAAALMATVCLGIVYLRMKGAAPGRSTFGIRAGVWTMITGIGSCFFVNNIIILTGLTSEAYEKANRLLYQPSLGIQIVAIGVLIPAAEEVIFRGLGYFRLRQRLSWFWAALFSAIYFGWYHGNIVQGVYAFCIGLLLAGVFEAYYSLWAPVCLHVTANLGSVLFTGLMPEELRLRIPAGIYLMASGAILILGIYKIREDVKKREVTVDSNSML